MLKFILLLVVLNSCATGIKPAKFKYEGVDSVTYCDNEKYKDRKCEKDGKTLANGVHRIYDSTADHYVVYSEGKEILTESYWTVDEGVNIKDIVMTDMNEYTTTFTWGLGMVECGNKNTRPHRRNEDYITGEELDNLIRKTNGTFTCEDVLKEIELLKKNGKNNK